MRTTCVDYNYIKRASFVFVSVWYSIICIRGRAAKHSPPFRIFPVFCFFKQLCSDCICAFIISLV